MKKTLNFSVEEYEGRIKKAQQLLEEKDYAFLLLSQPENLIYLTGYRTILYQSKFRPFLAIIPKDGDPVLILPILEKGVGEIT